MSRRTTLLLTAAASLTGLAVWFLLPGQDVTSKRLAASEAAVSGAATHAPRPSATRQGSSAGMAAALPKTAPSAALASLPFSPSAPALPASSGAAPNVSGVVPPAGGRASSRQDGPVRRSVADVLENVDLSDPLQRERALAEIAALENERKQEGLARARELGLPLRLERPDGTVQEIAGVNDNGDPLYFTTHNVSAAISTGANVLHALPYDLRGTNSLLLGVWDGGSARASHQEFGGRVSVRDGSGSIDHATHVAGTMIAAGAVVSARGMAPVAPVASYDWNSDKTEMTATGAGSATEAINSTNKFLISNHSYGYIAGWNYVAGGSPYRVWEWYGNGTTSGAIEADFGLYNTFARDSDALAFSAPYFLMFRSAGNERNNNPANSQAVALSPGSTTVANYDPAIHPAGDGTYRGGFENISFDAVAKNVVTVGSVLDAVTSGTRDPSKAAPSSFTSFGPTDDGRIKPDLVANGEGVYSSLNSGDASYGTYSGTSMSSPNAAGTAALLAQDHVRLFGQAMRASMLKGLLIHTADDRGNIGPDYKNGWGLINGKVAADLIRDHHANPRKVRMTEGTMPTNGTTLTHEFVWDGVSPIRATLCWTDPAGSATTISDLRSARLRNNLDLKIVAPDGTQHLPYIMPFVGTWTEASMDLPATTGINNTDNVEQVNLVTPVAPGVYRAVLSFQGTLANNQVYSLLISGSANEALPPPSLKLEGVTPASANAGGVVSLQLSGLSLAGVTSVQLTKDGRAPIEATSLSMAGEKLACQVNLANAVVGTWDVVVTKGSETSSLQAAFTVVSTLYNESFDGAVSGWSARADAGAVPWALSAAASHSPSGAYFAAGPAAKTTNSLVSAAINIPASASNLQLRFWHSYNLQSARDGGRLLISIDNGSTWFAADAADSGVSFAANGYTTLMARRGGKPQDLSIFSGLMAWSGNSGGFVETVLNLTDTAKFAGKTVRFQWVLATDGATASAGWFIDSISLRGDADLVNQPPSITLAASAPGTEIFTDLATDTTYSLVPAASTALQVSATDDGGAADLTYTWTASGPGPVFFLPNGNAGASSAQVDFEQLGDYQLNVTVADSGGLSVTSTLQVRVVAAASAVRVSPASASLGVGGSRQFNAAVLDQFGGVMEGPAVTFTWRTTGGGTVSSSGLFTATQAGENFAVVAGATLPNGTVISLLSSDGLPANSEASDFAQVTVTPGAAVVALDAMRQIYDGAPKTVLVSTDPPDLTVAVTYNGSPTGPSAAGSYMVEAVVTDINYQGGASGTLTIELSAYDAWRSAYFGEAWESDPAAASSADPDGDGADNYVEYHLGTHPADSGSRLMLSAQPLDSGRAIITVTPAVTVGRYTLKTWTDLTQEAGSVPLEITNNEVSASFLIPASAERNFYQLLYTPPAWP